MSMKPHRELLTTPSTFLLWAAIIFALYFIGLFNYLLFHSLAEILSIVIGSAVFLLVWCARHYFRNDYLQFIGIASLFVVLLDMIHMLAFKGMGVFPGHDANLSAQLWIAGRYVLGLSLLIAPAFFSRKLNPMFTFAGFALITALLIVSIFVPHAFPVCYVEGAGLTPFKIVSEYIISLIMLASIALLYRNRRVLDPPVYRLLVLFIAASIGAELTFTSYVSVYGFANLLGHLFKIVAYLALIQVVLVVGLDRPYSLLFRELEHERSDLKAARDELELRVQQRTAELRESNERYKLISENSTDVIWMLDPSSHRFTYVSPSVYNLYGLTPEEVMAEPPEKMLTPESLEGLPARIAAFPAGDESQRTMTHDAVQTHRDGHLISTEVVTTLVANNQGEVQVVGVSRDVTGRKRAEQTNARLATIVASSGDAIIGKDLSGAIVTWNTGAEKIYGYTAEEVLNKPISLLVPPDRLDEVPQFLDRISRGESLEHFETVRLRKGGKPIDVSLTISPMKDAEGRIVGASTIARDVTERKLAEVRQERLKNFYAALVSIDEAIMHSTDETRLFTRMCGIPVARGLIQMAWVGIEDPVSYNIIPIARYGKGTDYLDEIVISTRGDLPEGLGPTGIAWRDQRVVVNNDTGDNPHMAPWSNRATAYGWRSSASFPILRKNRIYAVFSIYSSEPHIFDEEMMTLLGFMINEVSFGLDGMDARQSLVKSEARLRSLMENAPFPMLIFRTRDGSLRFANRRAEIRFHVKREEALGALAGRFYQDPADRERLLERLREEGVVSDQEIRLIDWTGNPYWALLSASVVEFEDEPAIMVSITTKRRVSSLVQSITSPSLSAPLSCLPACKPNFI